MKVPFLYIWHVFSNPENPKQKNNPHKMKKAIYLLGLAFFFSVAVNAQANNAILFAENGEKFQVILNGILQNATPETNVKMTHQTKQQRTICYPLCERCSHCTSTTNSFFSNSGCIYYNSTCFRTGRINYYYNNTFTNHHIEWR